MADAVARDLRIPATTRRMRRPRSFVHRKSMVAFLFALPLDLDRRLSGDLSRASLDRIWRR